MTASLHHPLSAFPPRPVLRESFGARGSTLGTPRRSRRAFTLIELILALGMVGVLAFSLYQSMRISFKATAAADAAIAPARTADLAMELVAQDLENAITPNTTITNAINTTSTLATTSSTTTTTATSAAAAGNNNATTGYVLAGPFEGTQSQANAGQEADDLVFYTLSNSQDHPDANGEIKNVELTVDVPQGSQQQCLVRRVTSNLTTEQQVTPDEEILCRGVTAFALQYFDGTNWNATWDSTQEDNQLPAAVQVRLTIDRTLSNGTHKPMVVTRVFPLDSSGAALDTNVNGASTGL